MRQFEILFVVWEDNGRREGGVMKDEVFNMRKLKTLTLSLDGTGRCYCSVMYTYIHQSHRQTVPVWVVITRYICVHK